EAAAIAGQIVREVYPAQLREMGFAVTATATPMRDEVVGAVSRPLVVLLAAVGVVLLIACADVACLMLMRAAGRAREIAIRTALGAGRAHVVRLVFVEAGLLAGAGAAGGLALAWAVRAAMLTWIGARLPRAN